MEQTVPTDSGFTCLAMLVRFFEKPCDCDQLHYAHGDPAKMATGSF
jgi:hypothetical protein